MAATLTHLKLTFEAAVPNDFASALGQLTNLQRLKIQGDGAEIFEGMVPGILALHLPRLQSLNSTTLGMQTSPCAAHS